MPVTEYLIIDRLSIRDITRIFSRIKITETNCWEWQGARLRDSGYGVIRYQQVTETVHRLLYAWTVDKLPKRKRGQPFGDDDRELDHLYCSNKRCCNPVHLELVPHKTNSLRNSNSPMAKNSRKTHCLYGHPLPLEPNEHGKIPTRRCIPCRRRRCNAAYHRRQAGLSTSSSTPH